MKHIPNFGVAAVAACVLSACVAGSAESAHTASSRLVALFALGLWHGIIGPITLIVEIVNGVLPHLLPWKAHLYETRAAGPAYDLGFCIGFSSGPVAIRRRWGRR